MKENTTTGTPERNVFLSERAGNGFQAPIRKGYLWHDIINLQKVPSRLLPSSSVPVHGSHSLGVKNIYWIYWIK